MPKTNDEVLMKEKQFKKADIKILKAFADYILKTIESKGKVYKEKEYGSIEKMKQWKKNDYIKWLLQFDIVLKNKQEEK